MMEAEERPRTLLAEQQPLLSSSVPRRDSVSHDSHETTHSVRQSVEDRNVSVKRNTTVGVRVAAIVLSFFLTGMNVAAIGALLVQIESWYGLSDSKASLMFPTGVVGYICGTCLLNPILSRHGWRGMACVASFLQLLGVLVLSMAPPYGVVLVAHLGAGIGTGLADAGCNAWSSKLPKANVIQGFMHGAYSVGSIVGPMACAAVIKADFAWCTYYRGMLIPMLAGVVTLVLTFRFEDQRAYSATQVKDGGELTKKSARTKLVWLCGIFYFFYMAIETSYTNWIPAYMQRVRRFEPASAALSSSVFWLGMAIGRFGLGFVTEHFGLGVCVTTYILLATVFEVVLRFVQLHRFVLVLLGLIGVFFAPMFPSGILKLAKELSMHEYIGAVAAAAGIGQAGGAASQVIVGIMADKLGLEHLTDIVLVSSLLLLASWIVLCRMV